MTTRVCAVLLGSGLVFVQALADGIYEPVPLKDKEYDLIKTSEELNGRFTRRSLLFNDEQTLSVVRRVGYELAPEPTDEYIDYQFFILRDPSPNAFALPNGHIYIHTGMLARMRDEAQLAALLAHELNHVRGHHSVVNRRSSSKKAITSMVVGGVLGGVGALISAGLHASVYGFSRELEQEADDRAVELLLDSPYDPHALPELFEILAQDFEGLNPRIPTLWSTHPQLEARAARSWTKVVNYPARDRNPEAFYAGLLPLRLLTIRDYIQDDYPYTAVVLAQQMVEAYPAEPEAHYLLGDAWQAMGPRPEIDPEELTNADKRSNLSRRIFKTRQERAELLLETEEGRQALDRNLAHARDAYREAITLNESFAPAYKGLAEAYEQTGDFREAAQAYLDYAKLAADAPERAIVIERLKRLRDVIKEQESGDGEPS